MNNLSNVMIRLFMLLCFLVSGHWPSSAQKFHVSGEVTFASDSLFRGVSQTMGAPALQSSFTIDHDSGWAGSVWISNVDFTDKGDPDDGANVEVDVDLTYQWNLADDKVMSLAWVRYLYPGSHEDYDYSEFTINLVIDNRYYTTLSYSDDVFASGQPGQFFAAGRSFAPTDNWALTVEAGHYDLERAYGNSYAYAQILLTGSIETVAWQLGYTATSDEADHLFPASSVGNRVSAAFTVGF